MRLLLVEDERKLSRALVTILEHSSYTVDAVYNGADALDFSVCELSTDEGSIRLANKEFQMMELLLRNPGRVISADRFMEKIWESESDSGINVVWVYVSNLRKKLASLGSDAEIRTARGLGYYLAKQPGD